MAGKEPARSSDSGLGNAIFIVRARTGELLWKAARGNAAQASRRGFEHPELVNSIPATVVPLRNASGFTYRLYVGDTGGALWRVDLGESERQAGTGSETPWTLRKLAKMGPEPGGPTRAFFHAVDVVRSRDSYGPFDGVVIASGDGSNLRELRGSDYLFYVKDRHTGSASASASTAQTEMSAATQVPPIQFEQLPNLSHCSSGVESVGAPESCAGVTGQLGWKMAFEATGEKGISQPLVDGGRIFVTTYIPGESLHCGVPPGETRLYRVALNDAAPIGGSSRSLAHDVATNAPVIRVGNFLYIPGRFSAENAVANEAEGSNESKPIGEQAPFSPAFEDSKATRLIDLYWLERGVDAL